MGNRGNISVSEVVNRIVLKDRVRVVVMGDPMPKQSARFNKETGRVYQTTKIKNFEDYVTLMAKQQLPKGWQVFDGAMGCEVTLVFPIPKTFSQKKIREIQLGAKKYYKITKPDLTDNAVKVYFDGMEHVVYTNDARICQYKSEKIYGLEPRAEFLLYKIEG